MAIREILLAGDPRLQRTAKPVTEFNSTALNGLIVDMWETMIAAEGVGLAAPQIGVDLRIIVFACTHNSRYPESPSIPETVLINPVITPLMEDMNESWEGCLSVPGLRGSVSRYSRLQYRGYDAGGEIIEDEVADFHARVVQHEVDHLEGMLFFQRIQDMRKFGFAQALEQTGVMAT